MSLLTATLIFLAGALSGDTLLDITRWVFKLNTPKDPKDPNEEPPQQPS